MRRPLLVGAVFAAAAAIAAPASAQDDAGQPVVTGAVQVTDNPNLVRAHMTPLMARNPTNGELVIAEVDGRGTRECVVHISVDGGRSWFLGGGFMVKPFTDCSIGAEFGPTVMPFFDREGVLYVAFAANDPALLANSNRPVSTTDVREDIPRNAYLARSTDGGRTFATTLVAAGKEGSTQTAYIDAPSGAVDPKNPNNVYVGWGQGDWSNEKDPIRTMVAASTDAGKTWGAPAEINNGSGADYPWLTVDRAGGVHATYWSRGVGTEPYDPTQARPNGRKEPSPVMHAWSTDQGKTWQRAALDPGSQRIYRTPVIVADPNSDAIYAAWHGVPDPLNFIALRDGKDRVDVYFKASTDLGKTWGERRIVNDDPQSGVNHESPNIAIAPNGRVDVAWYDYRYSPRGGSGAGIEDVFYASSTDGGKTFSPNRRITDRSIDRSIGVYAGAIGSSINVGIASTDDVVYFAWQDSRNGRPNTQSEDVYSASLMLNGPEPVGTTESTGDDRGVALLLTGLALGAGLAMVVVWIVSRSRGGSRPTAAPGRTTETFDAVVAGGGPAGSVAARQLVVAGGSVLLVDPQAPGPQVGEALPPAARPLLRDLGLWDRLRAEGHRVCPGNDSVWGSPFLVSTDFPRVGEVTDRYRRDLATYYRMERRWPGSPFWQRRITGDSGRVPVESELVARGVGETDLVAALEVIDPEA